MADLESFVQFFEQMPTWQRLAWVAVCLTAGWLVEDGRPLFLFDYRKWVHARVNPVLFASATYFFHRFLTIYFGNIFSIWDRIFGTFVYDDVKRIRYGLNVLDGRLAQDVLYQLRLPFDRRSDTD